MKENQYKIIDMSNPSNIVDKITSDAIQGFRNVLDKIFKEYEDSIKPNILQEILTNSVINCFASVVGFCLLNQPIDKRNNLLKDILDMTKICTEKYMIGFNNELKNSIN